MFRHYIHGGRRFCRTAFSDICQDLATGMQRLAGHRFGAASQDWADPAEKAAERIADSVSSLKVERGRVDGTDPRSI